MGRKRHLRGHYKSFLTSQTTECVFVSVLHMTKITRSTTSIATPWQKQTNEHNKSKQQKRTDQKTRYFDELNACLLPKCPQSTSKQHSQNYPRTPLPAPTPQWSPCALVGELHRAWQSAPCWPGWFPAAGGEGVPREGKGGRNVGMTERNIKVFAGKGTHLTFLISQEMLRIVHSHNQTQHEWMFTVMDVSVSMVKG